MGPKANAMNMTVSYSGVLAKLVDMRARVMALEEAIEHQPQVDCPIRHHFAPGVYAREMTLPAGVVITGAVHKTCHLSILSKGKIKLVSDEDVVELSAPATILANAGTKRAIYAIEEAVWTNIHATNETDLDKLVEELTESTADQLMGGINNRQFKLSGALELKG